MSFSYHFHLIQQKKEQGYTGAFDTDNIILLQVYG